MYSKKITQLNEQGFASIVIAIVLLLVLSLVTVGFAQLMRKEQRQALDKQLSLQAYYAAESGVNDAAKAISNGVNEAKDYCGPATSGPYVPYLGDNTVGSAGTTNAQYTCLLINPTPTDVRVNPIGNVQSRLITMTSADSTDPIKSIRISWQDSDGEAKFALRNWYNSGQFLNSTNWASQSSTGVLSVGLLPLNVGAVQRNTASTEAYHAFLYPASFSAASNTSNQTGLTPNNYNKGSGDVASNGPLLDGKCSSANEPLFCSVVITGLNNTSYLLDLQSFYGNSNVNISAYGGDGQAIDSNVLKIKNAQTVVDSTGKAQDVLRRIQVRISSRDNYDHPDYSIESTGSICKQLQVEPNSGFDNCPQP